MNSHNITNESLALALMLVVVAILISHKEKLALEKDILWSVGRAIIQLIIVGYVLKYIFSVDDASLTLLMVLFICFNAAWNAQKRSKYIAKAFISSFIAITVGAGITLAVLILSGSIEFIPMLQRSAADPFVGVDVHKRPVGVACNKLLVILLLQLIGCRLPDIIR